MANLLAEAPVRQVRKDRLLRLEATALGTLMALVAMVNLLQWLALL